MGRCSCCCCCFCCCVVDAAVTATAAAVAVAAVDPLAPPSLLINRLIVAHKGNGCGSTLDEHDLPLAHHL